MQRFFSHSIYAFILFLRYCLQKNIFNFCKIQFIYFSFVSCAFVSCLWTISSSDPKSWRFTPMFSSKCFSFRSYIIHFKLSFVCGMRARINCILEYVKPNRVSAIWKDLLLLIEFSWHLCWKPIDHNGKRLFLDSQFCPLSLYVAIFMPLSILCITLFL